MMIAKRNPADNHLSISELTYQEINRAIVSRLAGTELEEYWRSLKGTGVRWVGQIVAVDWESRRFMSIGRSASSNVEFQLPQSRAL
jgi:hypothetical protein